MPYIDKIFYDNYSDVIIDENEFNILSSRAEDIINILTRDLQGVDFESLPISFKDKVKKATAAQIETLYQNGGTEALTGGISSGSIGKFSFSSNEESNSKSIPISSMTTMYLSSIGMLYQGIGCI